MDLNKSREYFDPEEMGTTPCHIIGCGAIGSTVAENLTRLGIKNICLWDMDIVNPHNIANQMFLHSQIGMPKVNAVEDILKSINPEAEITTREMPYEKQRLAGYVFLCVDNIELRRSIVEHNLPNQSIKAMFDFRMRLTDAQHYAASWNDEKEKRVFLDSMQFSHDEALSETPVSACGVQLSVAPTVRIIAATGVANFMNFVRKGKYKRLILIDAFTHDVDAF